MKLVKYIYNIHIIYIFDENLLSNGHSTLGRKIIGFSKMYVFLYQIFYWYVIHLFKYKIYTYINYIFC